MNGFKSKGGQVVQEQYTPFDCADFASYLANLKDADAVVAWFDGTTALRFLNQYHELGIRDRMPLVAAFNGPIFSPFILNQLPLETAEAIVGEYCPTPYTPLLDTEINKRFLEKWGAEMAEPEDSYTSPYEGALLAIAALEATGGDTTPEKLRDAILGVSIEGPQGPIRFDPETKCAVKPIYITRVEKRDGVYVWVPVKTYTDIPPFGLGAP